MNTNDILELVRAGFTKDEIKAMEGTTADTAGESVEVPDSAENKTNTNEANANTEYTKLADLVKDLTDTVKAMQADNAKRVSIPTENKMTADSAIKSFFGETPKN